MKTKNKIWMILLITGSVLIFTNSCKKSTDNALLTDKDGNVYNTVTIGTQVWMTENLKTTKYRNGDLIGTTIPVTKDITSESAAKYQWAYLGNENNVTSYGRLYTWNAVTDSRGVCPTGWHVPTDAEWSTLTTFLGDYSVAGGKLKETGTNHWISPNAGATNETGFTALAGGTRSKDGTFSLMGNYGFWWSSSESSAAYGWGVSMFYGNTGNGRVSLDKQNGFSVRCIKD
ncbi:MAG TPA: fibrobacter succinogenes major paralogous domain-containing protein [Bacteroidales bacterium]